MNFEARKFEPEDVGVYQSWMKERNLPAPDVSLLPKHGLVMLFKGEAIAMGFLYCTDAMMASIGNFMSDPKSDKQARGEAVEIAVDILSNRAEELGYKQVNVATNIKSLMERFENLGFEKCEENVSHFRRFL